MPHHSSSDRSAHRGKPSFILLVSAALALLAAILFYLLIGLLPSRYRRIDLTKNRLTELSDAASEFLEGVDQDVTIHLVCVAGKEDPTVSGFLERVDELSDSIRVDTVDPAVHPAFIAQFTNADLTDNSLIIRSAKRFKVVDSYDLYQFSVYDAVDGQDLGVYSYEDFSALLTNYAAYFSAGYYTYEQLFRGEGVVASAVDYVTSDDLPAIYTLRGHGESALPDGLLSAFTADNLEQKNLTLSAKGGVPDDADCVLIYAPLSDLSDSERDMLSDYLEKGGNLFLITDYRTADLSNFTRLMKRYGLTAGQGYLYESDGDSAASYPDLILANTDSASSYLGLGSYTALLLDAHPIYYGENPEESDQERPISYIPLFQTSQNGRFHALSDNESVDTDKPTDSDDPSGIYNMGVLASDGTSRAVWISSSYFLDSEINSGAAGGNYVYFLALLENISGKKDSLTLSSKAMVEDLLVINSGQAIFWSVILVGLIPLCILLFGIWITVRRRRT